MARGRGGRRVPENPAPVSGPGALSRRTDGGAGSDTQPLRSFPAQFHGQRQGLEDLQRAAPLAGGSGGGSPPTTSGAAPDPLAAMGLGPDGILGPTRRPNEPITAGIERSQVFPPDPDALLRAIAEAFPHPDVTRLLPPGG